MKRALFLLSTLLAASGCGGSSSPSATDSSPLGTGESTASTVDAAAAAVATEQFLAATASQLTARGLGKDATQCIVDGIRSRLNPAATAAIIEGKAPPNIARVADRAGKQCAAVAIGGQ